jgi:2-(1,2-epoxy-1,2-dihydrophenyl)acetyl-CoA isomerase
VNTTEAARHDDELLRHFADGVATFTLNRPQVANALRPAQRDRLIAWLEEAAADPDVRVVVIDSTGRHFCAGADLGGGGEASASPGPGDVSRMLRLGSQRLIAAVLDCEKPVIASVQGAAAGIGSHLALACDFVVAASDSRFIEVFVRRALVPDGGGAYLLARLVGPQRTKQLMMLGDDLPAPEAARLGLVTEVVEPGELDARVGELANRLAEAPTRTLAAIKWLVNASLSSSREQAFADEAIAQERNMLTEDAAEGLASFADRRPPRYRGR